MNNYIAKLACLCFTILIVGCMESNPLIGKWQGNVSHSDGLVNMFMQEMTKATKMDRMEIEFTKDSMITKQGGRSSVDKVRYKKVSENVWAVAPVDKEQWQEISIVDKDTLKMDVGMGVGMSLKRVK